MSTDVSRSAAVVALGVLAVAWAGGWVVNARGDATLAVLLVGSLRLQTPFAEGRLTLVYLGVSTLIVVTTFYGLILLWSWDASFGNGGGANENVADAPQRVLLALFSLSVIAYLATPLIARALPERDGSPR